MAKTILILAANPKDTPQLRLNREIREIGIGLQRARRRDEFILRQVLAARPIDVRRAMLDLKPNIVHFCGHGAGEQGIAFEDDAGHTKLVSVEALEGLFELFADTVQCVVLSACYSEPQAEAIARHIHDVIGVKEGIGDTAAIEFAVAFYDALGAAESVEFAYKFACNALQLVGIPEDMTPVLKSRRGSAQQTIPTLKYYVYISDMKVDMLYSQIPQGLRSRLATGAGLSPTSMPDSDTKYARVEAVTDYLVKHVGVSDVDGDEIGPYFKGTVRMRWGPFQNMYSSEEPQMALFAGSSRRTIGLVGSLKHVIGTIDSEATQSAPAISYMLSPLLKELAPELEVDPSQENYGNHPFGRDDDDGWALSVVSVAVQRLRGPAQRVEFFAKTLLQGRVRDESVLLGTPIYVALAD